MNLNNFVLVIDSCEDGRDLLTKLLEKKVGIPAQGVATAAAALELVGTQNPVLILLETRLSDMSGLELTQRLRKLRHLQDVPIIALTSLALPQHRQEILRAGLDGYILKPVQMQVFIQLIQRVITRQNI